MICYVSYFVIAHVLFFTPSLPIQSPEGNQDDTSNDNDNANSTTTMTSNDSEDSNNIINDTMAKFSK